jgi:hypothetical protein
MGDEKIGNTPRPLDHGAKFKIVYISVT